MDSNPSLPFFGGFSGTDRSTLVSHGSLFLRGETLGTADLDRGYVNFNLNRTALTQTATITGLTANYDSTSRIEIKHELLGTPVV